MNKSSRNAATAIIVTALLICGAYSFYLAYQIWGKYQNALDTLGHSIPFIFGYTDILFNELSRDIREYVALFPFYFLVGWVLATLGLVLLMTNVPRKKELLTSALLVVSSAFLFFEAFKVFEIYQWSYLQTTAPPQSYYGKVFAEANMTFKTLFPLYLFIGSVVATSGLILAIVKMKKRTSRFLLAFVVSSLLFAVGVSAIQANTFRMTSITGMQMNGVRVYLSDNLSQPATSIDWGFIEPKQTINKTVYIENTRNTPVILGMSIAYWMLRDDVQKQISLTWDYTGQTISASDVIPVTLNLVTSPDLKIPRFEFNILVSSSPT